MVKKLSKIVPLSMDAVCKKHGVLHYKVIMHWTNIVGSRLSTLCTPIAVRFPLNQQHSGLIVIGVSNPGYIIELQTTQNTIKERLITYIGHNIITKIKFIYIENL